MGEAVYRVEVFGNLAVCLGEVRFDRFPASHARDLLALLTIAQGQPVLRESLINSLWSGVEGIRGSNRLSVALSMLRRSLYQSGLNFDQIVASRRESLKLLVDGPQNEWVQFWTAIESASPDLPDQERESLLSRAASLHRGPLVMGANLAQILDYRRHAQSAHREAVTQLIALAESRGDSLRVGWLRSRLDE